MKMFAFLVVSTVASASVMAANCDDVRAAVAARLDAKGITRYSLDIVPREKVNERLLVVGSCEGGAKKIVYTPPHK